MYKIITMTGKTMLADYFETLERAEQLYNHLVKKVENKEFLGVILAYVPSKARDIEIIKYSYR